MTEPRLLPVQQNYLEGMKHLLTLYHQLKSLPSDRWFSDTVVKTVAKVFALTISDFSQSVFFGDGYLYHLRYGCKGTSISLSESDFSKFLRIFDDIHTEIVSEKLGESYRVTRSTASVDFLPVKRSQLRSMGRDLYSPVKNISADPECKIYHQKEPWYVNGEFDSTIYDQVHGDLNELSGMKEVFYVDIGIESHLIYSLSSIGPAATSDQDEVITSPLPAQETTFLDAIRYVMVKFYTIFGSFNRIKVCCNEPCRKLFIEKKLDAKFFCSNKCKMQYNANRQPRMVRLCRERQNQWLRNQLIRKDIIFRDIKTGAEIDPPDPNHVQKNECDYCQQPTKTGLCPVLKEYNSVAFQTIERYPKRAKITHKVAK